MFFNHKSHQHCAEAECDKTADRRKTPHLNIECKKSKSLQKTQQLNAELRTNQV